MDLLSEIEKESQVRMRRGMRKIERRLGPGEEAARILNRRMRAKARYRRKRDRKLGDWAGRVFGLAYYDELRKCEVYLPWRLTGYNPDNHRVKMVPNWTTRSLGEWWDTDRFWSRLRTGTLREV